MIIKYKNKSIILAVAWVIAWVIGFLLTVQQSDPLRIIGGIFLVGGTVLLILSLLNNLKAKGYHPAYLLLILTGCIGWMIILVLPDRFKEDTSLF